MSSAESWLEVQVDAVLDKAADEELAMQAGSIRAQLENLLKRAEAIKAMRTEQGKNLGKEARAQLDAIHTKITELSETLLSELPPDQRKEWEGKLKWL